MDLKKFVLEGNPVCRKEAVIVGDHFRITLSVSYTHLTLPTNSKV